MRIDRHVAQLELRTSFNWRLDSSIPFFNPSLSPTHHIPPKTTRPYALTSPSTTVPSTTLHHHLYLDLKLELAFLPPELASGPLLPTTMSSLPPHHDFPTAYNVHNRSRLSHSPMAQAIPVSAYMRDAPTLRIEEPRGLLSGSSTRMPEENSARLRMTLTDVGYLNLSSPIAPPVALAHRLEHISPPLSTNAEALPGAIFH